ncbi:MAG: TAXI family TRAP transporter solute-binding subunit [Acidobacteria bacterium]|nr:TAXI family TRAP transporter solute-binding subunit [Acidobacteriota bacterium]
MVKNSRAPILALVIGLAAVCVAGCEAPTRQFASLGTAGTGGIYYPLGGALARMIGEAVPDLQVTAEVTGGSVENLNRVAAGEMDVAMAIGTTLVHGLQGDDAERYADIRIVAPLYPNVGHILAAPNSDATSLNEAAGLRVSIGAPGSGTEQMAREILAAHGMSVDDIQPQYLSFSESATALRDGAIDFAILSVGYPAAAVLEATTTGGVRLLGIAPGPMSELLREWPYYVSSEIPAGAYPGMESALETAAVLNWVFARTDTPDTIVVAVLEALRDRRDELARVNDVARQIDLGALENSPLPLHEAAAEWLRTSGPATPGT